MLSYKGNYNPAVTLSLLLDGRITAVEMGIKYANQFLAAILAFITYKILI